MSATDGYYEMSNIAAPQTLRESTLRRATAVEDKVLENKVAPAIFPENKALEIKALESRHRDHYIATIYTAIRLMLELLVDPFTILCGVISVASVLFYTYAYDEYFAYSVSWTVASFVVIFPMTYVINQAFARRERGNACLATIRSLLIHIYSAHSQWDWDKDKNGRGAVPVQHAEGVKATILAMAHILADALTLPPLCPTATRDAPESYQMEEQEYYSARVSVRERAVCKLMHCIKKLALSVELLKYHGFPANEASRVNSYSHKVLTPINILLQLKDYRTPLRVRAFVRVYITVLPIFYGPYYAHMAKRGGSVAYAIVFALFISTALVALFNVQVGLEDAFVAGADGIDMRLWKDGLRRSLVDMDDIGCPSLEWDNRNQDNRKLE
jgi:hypothetical protein